MTTRDSETNDSERYFETNTDTGRIEKKYTDKEILEVLAEEQAAATGDVATALDCTRRTARKRLKQLADDGAIESVQTSAGYTWFPADEDE
jgi:predicted ArsR family transcriptional regulator